MENSTLSSSSHLMVGLRVRPLLCNEKARGEANAISIVPNNKSTSANNVINNISSKSHLDSVKVRIVVPEKSLADGSFKHIASINNAQSNQKLLESYEEKKEVDEISHTPEPSYVISHANVLACSKAAHTKELSYKEFSFDYCCGPKCKQNDVFSDMEVAKRIDSAFAGEAATVFCFGQTGSGKTFTLSGATVESVESTSEAQEKYSNNDEKTNVERANEITHKPNKKQKAVVNTKRECNNNEVKQIHKNTEDGIAYQAIKYIAHKMHQINSNTNCLNDNISIDSNKVLGNNEADSSADQKRMYSIFDNDKSNNNKLQCDVEKIIVKASYLELYNEHINDLLQCKDNLNVRWSSKAQSFYVENLLVVECTSEEDLCMVLREGDANRKRTAHLLNRDSSRSHVIITFYIEHYYYNYVHASIQKASSNGNNCKIVSESHTSNVNEECNLYECHPTTFGKLTLVDLAGSERLKRTHSDGVDTKSINRSLFTLCTVIEQLATREEQKQKHHDNDTLCAHNKISKENTSKNLKRSAANNFVSYRSSLLTKLLYDSLHGSGHTLMIACVAPSMRDVEESLRTLYYAQRARRISYTATIRVNTEEQERVNMMQTIRSLKAENDLFRRVLNLTNVNDVISEELLYAKLNAMSELRCANHQKMFTRNAITNEFHPSESDNVKIQLSHNTKPSTAPTPITSSTKLPSLQLQPIKGINSHTATVEQFKQREMKRHTERHYSLPISTLNAKSSASCAPLLQPLANAATSKVKETNCTAEDNASVSNTLSQLTQSREQKSDCYLEHSQNHQCDVHEQNLQQAQRLMQESKNNKSVLAGDVTDTQVYSNALNTNEVKMKSTLDLLNALPNRAEMINSIVTKSKLPLNNYGFRPAPRQKELAD